MCRPGTFNAGSQCVDAGTPRTGNCKSGEVYVAEAGACMIGE
jgi:hypothetical protein